MIDFECTACGKRLRVSDDKAGRRGRCPACQASMTVPRLSEAAGPVPSRHVVQSAAPPVVDQPAARPAPVSPARSVDPAGAGDRGRCPSCDQDLGPDAKVCVRCGIHLPSGRPLLTADDTGLDGLHDRAEQVIRPLSWLMALGIYPIYSEARGRYRPYVTWAVAALTVVVSVWFWTYEWTGSPEMRHYKNLMLWPRAPHPDMRYVAAFYEETEYGDPRAWGAAMRRLAEQGVPEEQIPEAAFESLSPAERSIGQFRPYQLVTHALLHGGVIHLAGNLLFLLVLGSRVNTAIGNVLTALLYPVLAAAAGLIHLAANPENVPIPCVGASGAIMGLAGMYLLLFPLHRVHMAAWLRLGLMFRFRLALKIFSVPGFAVVLFYIGFDVLYTVIGMETGTAHWAHMGGFAAGAVICLALMAGRLIRPQGDLVSLVLGRYAWPLIGRPRPFDGTAR